MKNSLNYHIIKRSNLLDYDGSALHDSFEIIKSFDEDRIRYYKNHEYNKRKEREYAIKKKLKKINVF